MTALPYDTSYFTIRHIFYIEDSTLEVEFLFHHSTNNLKLEEKATEVFFIEHFMKNILLNTYERFFFVKMTFNKGNLLSDCLYPKLNQGS